jgi:translation initiation factor 2B subunit (eIF-2B alpha/beta/delta family)
MTEHQEKLLAVLEVRVRDLMAFCDRQKQKVEELTRSLQAKDEELKQAIVTIEELKAKCNNMLTARIISADDTEVRSAKKRMTKLVRDIDECIALLNKCDGQG